MVQLVDSDIKTREVLDWKGVTSCTSWARRAPEAPHLPQPQGHQVGIHLVDLFTNENFLPWFLGSTRAG